VAGLLDPYLPNRQAETVALCFNDVTSFFEAFSADSAVQSLENMLRNIVDDMIRCHLYMGTTIKS
jgi:hypothetical protein